MLLERAVRLPVAEDFRIEADLTVGARLRGLVVFAHGSGSSRRSHRNRLVAEMLQERQMATLLLDLLTPEEEEVDRRTRDLRFDIPLLADRLSAAAAWVRRELDLGELPYAYYGASTGAAAALDAAAREPAVAAVVSRGGRPDLAGASLAAVRAPTLLIVGGADTGVLDVNRQAQRDLPDAEVAVVRGATHLFEEPGALQEVGRLSADWFEAHFPEVLPGTTP